MGLLSGCLFGSTIGAGSSSHCFTSYNENETDMGCIGGRIPHWISLLDITRCLHKYGNCGLPSMEVGDVHRDSPELLSCRYAQSDSVEYTLH